MDVAFGGWLIAQGERSDWIGQLAQAAAKDRRFPRGGDPHAVRTHLSQAGAEPDIFEMLDDAEAAWLTAAQ